MSILQPDNNLHMHNAACATTAIDRGYGSVKDGRAGPARFKRHEAKRRGEYPRYTLNPKRGDLLFPERSVRVGVVHRHVGDVVESGAVIATLIGASDGSPLPSLLSPLEGKVTYLWEGREGGGRGGEHEVIPAGRLICRVERLHRNDREQVGDEDHDTDVDGDGYYGNGDGGDNNDGGGLRRRSDSSPLPSPLFMAETSEDYGNVSPIPMMAVRTAHGAARAGSTGGETRGSAPVSFNEDAFATVGTTGIVGVVVAPSPRRSEQGGKSRNYLHQVDEEQTGEGAGESGTAAATTTTGASRVHVDALQQKLFGGSVRSTSSYCLCRVCGLLVAALGLLVLLLSCVVDGANPLNAALTKEECTVTKAVPTCSAESGGGCNDQWCAFSYNMNCQGSTVNGTSTLGEYTSSAGISVCTQSLCQREEML
jgi:hypothetical protein